MTIKDMLTTYWSQITLILFGIGFLIKSSIDLSSKKTEINHSLFQQKKLESINSFFSNYASTAQMWKDIPIYKILERKMTAKEIDNYIFPLMNELRRNVVELKIYFKENEHKNFVSILENMHDIKGKLHEEYFHFGDNKTIIEKSNDFQCFRDEKLKENENIFKKITTKLQRDFS